MALGSNLGDRERNIHLALEALVPHLRDLRPSTLHRTEPVGVGAQPEFLNAAATGETALAARALLETLLDIERRLGRERPYPGAPRTLDLDLILYGNAVIDEPPSLVVPHPRFRERLFVLEPLNEVAAGWIDPVTGRSVSDLLASLRP